MSQWVDQSGIKKAIKHKVPSIRLSIVWGGVPKWFQALSAGAPLSDTIRGRSTNPGRCGDWHCRGTRTQGGTHPQQNTHAESDAMHRQDCSSNTGVGGTWAICLHKSLFEKELAFTHTLIRPGYMYANSCVEAMPAHVPFTSCVQLPKGTHMDENTRRFIIWHRAPSGSDRRNLVSEL